MDTNSSVSPTVVTISYGFYGLELLLHPLSIIVSLANFALVLNSAVLHTNLKCILMAQSVSICICELCRLVYMMIKLSLVHILGNPNLPIFGSIFLYSVTFRTLLAYVLLAERVLATVMFRRYQQFGGLWFNLGWPIALLLISGVIQFTQEGSPQNVSALTVPCIAILFVMQSTAILILVRIYAKNKKRYTKNEILTLNQRFQLSENIRTVRQLYPTFLLYTLSVLLNYGIKLLFAFNWVIQDEMVKFTFLIQSSLLAIANIMIEFTVISHHPMLKRKALAWIRRFCQLAFCLRHFGSGNRVRSEREQGSVRDRPKSWPKNLFGEELLVISQKQEDHFRMLQEVWK